MTVNLDNSNNLIITIGDSNHSYTETIPAIELNVPGNIILQNPNDPLDSIDISYPDLSTIAAKGISGRSATVTINHINGLNTGIIDTGYHTIDLNNYFSITSVGNNFSLDTNGIATGNMTARLDSSNNLTITLEDIDGSKIYTATILESDLMQSGNVTLQNSASTDPSDSIIISYPNLNTIITKGISNKSTALTAVPNNGENAIGHDTIELNSYFTVNSIGTNFSLDTNGAATGTMAINLDNSNNLTITVGDGTNTYTNTISAADINSSGIAVLQNPNDPLDSIEISYPDLNTITANKLSNRSAVLTIAPSNGGNTGSIDIGHDVNGLNSYFAVKSIGTNFSLDTNGAATGNITVSLDSSNNLAISVGDGSKTYTAKVSAADLNTPGDVTLKSLTDSSDSIIISYPDLNTIVNNELSGRSAVFTAVPGNDENKIGHDIIELCNYFSVESVGSNLSLNTSRMTVNFDSFNNLVIKVEDGINTYTETIPAADLNAPGNVKLQNPNDPSDYFVMSYPDMNTITTKGLSGCSASLTIGHNTFNLNNYFSVKSVGNNFSLDTNGDETGRMTVDLDDSNNLTITIGDGNNSYTATIPAANLNVSGDVLLQNPIDSSDSIVISYPSLNTIISKGLSGSTTALTLTPSEKSRNLGIGNGNFLLKGGTKGCEQTIADLKGISINDRGVIVAEHPIFGSIELGRIDLATFDNPAGLSQIGDTYFAVSRNSGPAIVSTPGTRGMGNILGGTLETSNTDLAHEMADMITTQRGFQACSRTITVSDSMLEELINLKR